MFLPPVVSSDRDIEVWRNVQVFNPMTGLMIWEGSGDDKDNGYSRDD